jgi:hypothetical protein
VGSTPQLDVPDRGLAAQGVRIHVVELQEAAFRAAAAGRRHERAPPEVAQPHRALHLGRDMAGSGPAPVRGARPLRRRELLLREVGEQGGQGAVQDRGLVPRRHRVAEQVFGKAQLFESVAADGDLNPVAVR